MVRTIALACALSGCSEGATLVRESAQGGIVTYLYQEDRGGPMFSRHRNEALAIIAQKCPAGYSIVQESEARGTSTVQGTIEGTEDNSRYRRWGLQFRCKESPIGSSNGMKGQP
jgi:hypothetical protein